MLKKPAVTEDDIRQRELETRKSRTQSRRLCSTIIDRLFMRLLAMYGSSWSSQFPNQQVLMLAKREWDIGVEDAGLDEDSLLRGLVKCRDSEDRYPPTLPVFLGRCKPGRVAACHRQYVALPKPKPNPELAKRSIAEMRGALRGRAG